jgi:voltage-gated sodium channel
LRFITTINKKRFFHNAWNVFDTLIVTISLIPIDQSEYALLARLVRIFRVLRLVSAIPELRLLVNALVKALPSMGYVLLLMFILFYIYAAVGSFIFESINPTLWGDVAISMLTLFRVVTFEDWTDVMYETMAVHPWAGAYYLSFIFFNAFVFLNMMIGIVIDKMQQEHASEDDDSITRRLQRIEEKLDRLN